MFLKVLRCGVFWVFYSQVVTGFLRQAVTSAPQCVEVLCGGRSVIGSEASEMRQVAKFG